MAKPKIVPSNIIKYGDLECVVLDVEQDKVLVITKDCIGNMPLDEGNRNNFPNGTLCKYLNKEFINKLKINGADISALVPATIDLTSDDGLKDYGKTTQKVFLLTCDMYRKYRFIIPNINDHWWWLATAYTTESNGNANRSRFVYKEGTLSVGLAWFTHIGVRPAFYIKSSTIKSPSHSLSEFTTEDLLKEVLRRNAKSIETEG